MGKLEWIPMESNPDVMNAFCRTVGVKPHITVVDVLGFEPELLQMVDGKVEGLLLCYPMKGETDNTVDEDAKNKLYFMRQTIRNACATMALIHLLANQCHDDDFDAKSSLKDFIKESKQLEPEVKANKFESCETIATAHESASVAGQTDAPPASDSVEYHFISIIHNNNTMYEMDGRKLGPINHGPTSPETFLSDAVNLIKKFVNNDPANPNFSMQAVCRI